MLHHDKVEASDQLKARFYLSSVYGACLYATTDSTREYAQHLKWAIGWLERSNQADDLVYGYSAMAAFYLFSGQAAQGLGQAYLVKAEQLLSRITKEAPLATYSYIKTWLAIANADYVEANTAIVALLDIAKQSVDLPLSLYATNLLAAIKLHEGKHEEAYALAANCHKRAIDVFHSEAKAVIAESLIIKARYYLVHRDYNKTIDASLKAKQILEIVSGGQVMDINKASIHVLLGEAYAHKGEYTKARDNFQLAEQFYADYFKTEFSALHEISNLFADYAILGIQVNNSGLTKKYINLLTTHFSLNNDTTLRVLLALKQKNLPLPR